jgi:hypothetical protein
MAQSTPQPLGGRALDAAKYVIDVARVEREIRGDERRPLAQREVVLCPAALGLGQPAQLLENPRVRHGAEPDTRQTEASMVSPRARAGAK